jgi:hypothetical protein
MCGWDPVAFDRTFLANVTAPAQRGATVLQVCCCRQFDEWFACVGLQVTGIPGECNGACPAWRYSAAGWLPTN